MSDSQKSEDGVKEERILALRNEIDNIDDTILELINRRLLIGKEIGRIKGVSGIRVLDRKRETEIFERLTGKNQGPLKPSVIHHIFSVIMASSREMQMPQMVTYLGPEGTHTHMAAANHFGHAGTFVPQGNIRDIFDSVTRGTYQYGVVPVENSIEGAVNFTLDMLFESSLQICAESYQAISHYLLSNSGALEDIRVVYSHPQALSQCRGWLRKNLPNAALNECASTAHAAQIASSESGVAAVASRAASTMYNLRILGERIEDFTRNVTRFVVIGKDAPPRTGNDKTSVIFVTSHVPGALFKALQPIAESGINMVKLESRPTKHENWKYFFVMDVEGHQDDSNIAAALEKLSKSCLFLKKLGSYPKCDDSGFIDNGNA